MKKKILLLSCMLCLHVCLSSQEFRPLILSKQAEFVGGQVEMNNYLSDNLNNSIIENFAFNEDGYDLLKENDGVYYIKLKLELLVSKDGTVLLKKIPERVSKELFDEFKRVIESMPKWNPALNNEMVTVNSSVVLPLLIPIL